MKTITIIEHTVRQYLVEDNQEDDFDPWDGGTYVEELDVSDDTQERYTDGWEIAEVE